MKAALDTDVIIRLLTGDDPAKQARAVRLFEAAEQGELELMITSTVIADAVFVLTSTRLYGQTRQEVAEMLTALITLKGLEVEHLDRTLRALQLFAAQRIDFGDAYLAAAAMELGTPAVYSFDQDFDGIRGLRRLEP